VCTTFAKSVVLHNVEPQQVSVNIFSQPSSLQEQVTVMRFTYTFVRDVLLTSDKLRSVQRYTVKDTTTQLPMQHNRSNSTACAPALHKKAPTPLVKVFASQLLPLSADLWYVKHCFCYSSHPYAVSQKSLML
jgi:hypothetical protein